MTGALSTVSGSGADVWAYDAIRYDLSTFPDLQFTHGVGSMSIASPLQLSTLRQSDTMSSFDDEFVGYWIAPDTNGPVAAALLHGVPEPGALLLLGLGLIGAGITARRRS